MLPQVKKNTSKERSKRHSGQPVFQDDKQRKLTDFSRHPEGAVRDNDFFAVKDSQGVNAIGAVF